MGHVLLLGAGFSRNWGGWLATEVFEYLLGCPEIANDPNLRALLWRRQPVDGFEGPWNRCNWILRAIPGRAVS